MGTCGDALTETESLSWGWFYDNDEKGEASPQSEQVQVLGTLTWQTGAGLRYDFHGLYRHKKILKTIFYNCLGIKMNIIQAGVIIIYSLL